MVRRLASPLALSIVALCLSAGHAHAQLPDCNGHDPAAASAEFEAGNALLAQSIDHLSHRRTDRAHEAAAQALEHFDRQCELGDASAYAERGAALLLLGEMLRSAQSYDAYLAAHPLDSLDARTRRRIEPNLQPGTIDLEVENPRGHLFVNDLDFGPLPRPAGPRIPFGDYTVEVRDESGTVLASQPASLSAETSHAQVHLFVEPLAVETTHDVTTVHEITPPPPPPPPPDTATSHTDFLPFYIASGVATAVGLGLGVGLLIAADDRARTYNSACYPTIVDPSGCSAVLSERDTDFIISAVGFALSGIGIAGLIVSFVLDAGQGHAHTRVRLSLAPGGLGVSGTF